MNERFQNALKRVPQAVPPIWLMRQAGRYQRRYQALRQKYSFVELCKQPEVAAEVACGAVLDFDYDVAILFSDLLFPLEAMGIPLEYGDGGPRLGFQIDQGSIAKLRCDQAACELLAFQGDAVAATRAQLAADKSLIGFVGAPFTLFAYACEGKHSDRLKLTKSRLALYGKFCEVLMPLLNWTIERQLSCGAEIVMMFDTAAGELSPQIYDQLTQPMLSALCRRFPSKIGYYARGVTAAHYQAIAALRPQLAGIGVDHRFNLAQALGEAQHGFVQGNFDEALIWQASEIFTAELKRYLAPLRELTTAQRSGWVCGLGHGVLPQTPEDNVKKFVDTIREVFND